MNRKQKAIQVARTLLRTEERAYLSTHSNSKPGFPFGSVTAFMADYQGHPIFYTSNLAQHTKNIKTNPKMSLLVSSYNSTDINAAARLTLLGEAKLMGESELSDYAAAFYLRFPESKQYKSAHDFEFYRLQVEHVRFIGGFGEIYWLAADHFLLPVRDWNTNLKPAIDHMNQDHQDALQLMYAHLFNEQQSDVKMTHLYEDGFVLQVDGRVNHYVPFEHSLKNKHDIRARFIQLTRQARLAQQGSV